MRDSIFKVSVSSFSPLFQNMNFAVPETSVGCPGESTFTLTLAFEIQLFTKVNRKLQTLYILSKELYTLTLNDVVKLLLRVAKQQDPAV